MYFSIQTNQCYIRFKTGFSSFTTIKRKLKLRVSNLSRLLLLLVAIPVRFILAFCKTSQLPKKIRRVGHWILQLFHFNLKYAAFFLNLFQKAENKLVLPTLKPEKCNFEKERQGVYNTPCANFFDLQHTGSLFRLIK